MTLYNKINKSIAINFTESKLFVPAFLLLFSVLAYGLFIHRLGSYWDDFPYLYLNHSQGIIGYPAYMATDRPFSFVSSTNKLLPIYYDPPGCVHILDPSVDVVNNAIPASLKQVLPLSNSGLINDLNSSQLPSVFKPEPAHNWCFFYERADLARQQGKWDEIVHIGNQILSSNLKPSDLSEYFPFIEGFANTSNLDSAVKLSRLILNTSPGYNPMQCVLWKRILERISLDTIPDSVNTLFYSELKCFKY